MVGHGNVYRHLLGSHQRSRTSCRRLVSTNGIEGGVLMAISCSQENITKQFGLNGQSFVERYHSQVMEMKRLLLAFMKSIRDRKETQETGNTPDPDSQIRQAAGTAESADEINIDIEIKPNGFPILPREILGDLTKRQWEFVLRKYLSLHYSKSFHLFFCTIGLLSAQAWQVAGSYGRCPMNK